MSGDAFEEEESLDLALFQERALVMEPVAVEAKAIEKAVTFVEEVLNGSDEIEKESVIQTQAEELYELGADGIAAFLESIHTQFRGLLENYEL